MNAQKEGKLAIVQQIGFIVGIDDTNTVETDFVCDDCSYNFLLYNH